MFNPNPAMPWFTPTGTIAADPRGVTANDIRETRNSGGVGAAPNLDTPQGADAYAQQWQAYVQQLQQALAASSGFERWKIEQELRNAEKGRDNAYKIAQLQAKTSRYGVDQQTRVALEQLKENARQFDATHGLEMQRFGLDVAEAYTKYASTPDMRWSAADFDSAVQRVGLGQGPAPISTHADRPVPKTWESFDALRSYRSNPPAGYGMGPGASVPNATTDSMRTTNPVGGAPADANGDGIPDPRHKAIRAVADALPPSAGTGTDGQDWAALRAIESLYMAGRPGSLERLGPARRKIAQAGMARLGYDPNLAEEEYQRGLPGQTSVRSY